MIKLYFSPPSEGGHGYSLGRVPINSCDFSPASYNFDNVTGDADLTHFDADVKHDVEVSNSVAGPSLQAWRGSWPPLARVRGPHTITRLMRPHVVAQVGMIPMIQAALKEAAKGTGKVWAAIRPGPSLLSPPRPCHKMLLTSRCSPAA